MGTKLLDTQNGVFRALRKSLYVHEVGLSTGGFQRFFPFSLNIPEAIIFEVSDNCSFLGLKFLATEARATATEKPVATVNIDSTLIDAVPLTMP